MTALFRSLYSTKYDGKLIYKTSDTDGLIEVVDLHNIRSMHFGSRPKQSSLDLMDPNRLCLEYTKYIMACLLYNPIPENCLILGLGGGSISRFFHHHYSDINITTVEIRQKVIDVARRFFKVPESKSFKILNYPAEEIVASGKKNKYDLIITDIFNQHGMVKTLLDANFIENLKRKLSNNGILAINLWLKPEKLFDKIISILDTFFHKRLILVPIIHRTNCIVLGINSEDPRIPESLMLETATRLQKKLDIDFIELYQIIKEYNSDYFL